MDNLIHYQGALKDLPYGTVVVDCDGDAWQKNGILDRWIVIGMDDAGDPDVVIEEFLPVELVYTPDEA